MNKSTLISTMAKKSGLTKSASAKALKAMLSSVSDVLANKGTVHLTNFGSFSVRHRKARKGRNPQTGATLTISARNVPAFKPGKALKAIVNK